MVDDELHARLTRVKDAQSWQIGTDAEVAWIRESTVVGLTITSAIPPIFDAYATIFVPGDRDDRTRHDQALLAILSEQAPAQPWWLGYLDTGADDVVFHDVPKVLLYSRWPYVFVEAGPPQAASWKDASSWRGPLPDVIFPADQSWLLSTLWDDEWRCIGGPAELIERLDRDANLEMRVVHLGEDATPPGHRAY